MSAFSGFVNAALQYGINAILVRPKRSVGPFEMQVVMEEQHTDDLEITDPGYMARALCDQNVSAVCGSALLVRRSLFDQLAPMSDDHNAALRPVVRDMAERHRLSQPGRHHDQRRLVPVKARRHHHRRGGVCLVFS